MKIIIFGASGTGKTTIGKLLSKRLSWKFIDSDEYYWERTNPPFEKKIPLKIRNENLKEDFQNNEDVIVSGSLCTWSNYWDTAFDLGIFLWLPKDARMKRLSKREKDRYGKKLNDNIEMKKKSFDFLRWAEKYDDVSNEGASIIQHLNWMKELSCPIIEIKGDITNKKRMNIILDNIEGF